MTTRRRRCGCDGPPRRRTLFPLVVGQLLDARAVVPHHEDLAVGLRGVRIDRFILEAHARAREHDSLAIGRPALVGIVATRGRQLLRAAAIGFHRPNRIAARRETREHDQIAAGRPEGEVVIAAGQVRHNVRLEIDDLETATAALSERSRTGSFGQPLVDKP